MKRTLTVFLALLTVVLSIGTGAAEIPDVLKNPMLNYTGTATVSTSFENAQDIVAAFETLIGQPIKAGPLDTVDFAALLESLFAFSGNATVKADISEDYNKLKLSMEADYDYSVDVNQNLGVSADMKVGLWLDMDTSDVINPECKIVISSPISTKYTYIDLFSGLDDQTKLMTVAIVKMFLNKDFVDGVNAEIVKFYQENAEITSDGKDFTMKLDNGDFLKLMDLMTDIMSQAIKKIVPTAEENEQQNIRFADSGITMLGEGGYVIEYFEDGSIKEYCDIEMNIGDFYKYSTGQELMLENELVFKFTVESNGKLFDVGSTAVSLPELTEDNSLDLAQLFETVPEEDSYYDENSYTEYEQEYPYFYVDTYTEYVPVVDGEYLIPFRAVLENAYNGNVDIAYENGNVTVTSEYFDDMEKLAFTVGTTKANVDGYEFEVGNIVLENGVTYVSADFFEVIFGWACDWASYDILNDQYNFGFYTESFDDEYYGEW